MITLSPEQKKKLVSTGVAALAVLLLIYWGLIRVQIKTHQAYKTQITDIKSKLENANRYLQQAAFYKQEVAEKKAQLDAIEAGMASGGDLYSWMIRTVGNFRQAYKVEIPNYSAVSIGEVGLLPDFPYPAAICVINGFAYYHDLGKFLADFENQFPYMQVRVQEIRPDPGPVNAEDQEKLKFTLQIVALVSKSAAAR